MIKRKLPRPRKIPTALNPSCPSKVSELIEKEMLSLIYSDGIDNPVDGVEFPAEVPEYKTHIAFEKLEEAREMVAAELPEVIGELTINESDY